LPKADPSGDWATVLLTLCCEVRCIGVTGERSLKLSEFLKDAYTTSLASDELVSEVVVKVPQENSGGAYIAFKRAAPVYPTASAAVQVSLEGDCCREIAIALGCVGLFANSSSRRRILAAWPADYAKAYPVGSRGRACSRRSPTGYARFG